MKIFKRIISWLGNPKWYALIPIVLIAIGSMVTGTLVMLFDATGKLRIWGYVLLGIMAVTVSYSVFGIIRIYSSVKDRILKWAEKHPRIKAAFNHYGFTALVTTAISILVTFAFAAYNGAIAIGILIVPTVPSSAAIWFGALTAYYIVLAALRSHILVRHGKNRRARLNGQSEIQTQINDGKLYRSCGIMLFLLPVCLSFAIMQMVSVGSSFIHTGITIYAYAAYAFFKIITAIYSFIKERRNKSMVITSIKDVKLADAMVSMLALQTAMFREFGNVSDMLAKRMNGITGAVVCALTIALGIYMIVSANIRIKKLRQAQNQGAEIIEENKTIEYGEQNGQNEYGEFSEQSEQDEQNSLNDSN